MLRFENLSKRYGDHIVFQGLRYDNGTGCVALNDEMGSGKTTLLGVLAGEIEPDAGDVWLAGHSLRTEPLKAKSMLAYVPDDCIAYPLLSGRAFLEEIASARQTALDSGVLELASRFGLAAHLEKRFEQMSFGTRKKIFLSATLLGKPAAVIADEPTGGLDAAARSVLVELFTTLARDRTVFFCSHDAAFVQACSAKTISFADLAPRA
ncbi:ATP-binding cassette domain-containing protein [Trinickia mobilis]|uniref:ATP-binding cassette domain-containing protein n=1 Tax=Trinickia mobilis TaxID=2816356 RepID=UPI001A8CD6DC|nr:ABC transporter ATP-binding protein [Trinickia mobilis]